jgi:membrane-associated phospholipid phosphatase
MSDLSGWYLISFLGEPYGWLVAGAVLVLIYFIIRKFLPEKRILLKAFLIIFIPSLLISLGIVQTLKVTLDTPRPCMPCTSYLGPPLCNAYCPMNAGFPSGHATAIFTVFTAFYLAFRKRVFLVLFVIPLLVSASRLMLGVHSLLDVAGGAFLGIIVTLLWKSEVLDKRKFFKK